MDQSPSSEHPVANVRLPLRELSSGIDALYLSGRCELSEALFNTLEERRAAAVEADGPVPLRIAGEDFGVEPRSFGRYRYRLVHRSGLVGVTQSDKLPSIYVQPNAEFLHGVGPEMVVQFYEAVGEYLAGGLSVRWSLSRIDLFCDVQGWPLGGDDRHLFVCRARTRTTHEDNGDFTGFEFGRRTSGTISARIYDKTVQVEHKGLDWWHGIWGDRYDRDRPVLRIEFEINRTALREFGIDSPREGIEAAPRLWRSVSDDWLTFRSPTADQTSSRWPIAPEWSAVQQASMASGHHGLERLRAGRRKGELRTLLPGLVGYLASAGAIVGTSDIASTLGAVRSLVAADEIQRGVDFAARVSDRVRARAFQ